MIGGIRSYLERAGAPEHDCPGVECCEWRQQGADPCAGCELRAGGTRCEKDCAVEYALLLEAYVEIFRPAPSLLTWRDLDLVLAVRMTRADLEFARMGKLWKQDNK